jgi:hypothetical protein
LDNKFKRIKLARPTGFRFKRLLKEIESEENIDFISSNLPSFPKLVSKTVVANYIPMPFKAGVSRNAYQIAIAQLFLCTHKMANMPVTIYALGILFGFNPARLKAHIEGSILLNNCQGLI